jgi:hypothetical protein
VVSNGKSDSPMTRGIRQYMAARQKESINSFMGESLTAGLNQGASRCSPTHSGASLPKVDFGKTNEGNSP